jgi:anti-sigma B factor antagonist
MTRDDDQLHWVNQNAVVTLPAEIDVTNSPEVREALMSAASRSAAVLIVDMSDTTFCDSNGVGAIIAAYNQTAAAGIQFRLVTKGVLRILTIIGADQLFPIYPTMEAALAEPAAIQHGRSDLNQPE